MTAALHCIRCGETFDGIDTVDTVSLWAAHNPSCSSSRCRRRDGRLTPADRCSGGTPSPHASVDVAASMRRAISIIAMVVAIVGVLLVWLVATPAAMQLGRIVGVIGTGTFGWLNRDFLLGSHQ